MTHPVLLNYIRMGWEMVVFGKIPRQGGSCNEFWKLYTGWTTTNRRDFFGQTVTIIRKT